MAFNILYLSFAAAVTVLAAAMASNYRGSRDWQAGLVIRNRDRIGGYNLIPHVDDPERLSRDVLRWFDWVTCAVGAFLCLSMLFFMTTGQTL